MTTCLTCLYFLAYFLIVSYICSIFPTPLISLAVASSASLVHFPCLTPLLMLHVTSCASGLASHHFSALMLCATLSHALCHISDFMLLHMHLATSRVSCHFSCFTSFLMLRATRVSHHFSYFTSLLMLYMTLHASHALLLMLYGTSHASWYFLCFKPLVLQATCASCHFSCFISFHMLPSPFSLSCNFFSSSFLFPSFRGSLRKHQVKEVHSNFFVLPFFPPSNSFANGY